ncbi:MULTISPECIES: ArsA family ATPase [Acidiplasma]|jgi:arsenite-transporting ATPase|uniref:Putative arsenical pump-driving ATPase n=1 Tax=Acidiplasma aeolicum TaxID=507754 RepID=A0A0P9D2M5_9ARCH|nr:MULTISPECIES: ArsA family ATPase [Acidiplasma]KJE49625.1 arsenic ABC transporter ATPase [Acidiplasma sp. MBA-1]KPV46762.1 arsenic ABC transporter ATPase [Acidiplasma aeolicum]KQB34232.1 arsenic-transporting ATPase [Acidiplasma aeolicum]WMT55825.1 MAG: ArsA family ATPase [Acidiplasma sp.]
MSRVLLYTGKGGVGKTSVAASTGLMLSKKYKTVVMSTDPAHSLSDSLEAKIGSEATKIYDNFYAQEININDAIKSHWNDLREYLTALFQYQGLDPISAEEIAILPGFEEAAYLLYINDYINNNDFDVIVVDSAPTGEALRLLSFPEVMRWYMEKVFPISRTAAKIARPFMKPFSNLPMPNDKVFESAEALYDQLGHIHDILQNPEITSIRLVTNADQMSYNETKRAFTYLLLYGYPVDAVIANKIYTDDTGDFFREWRESQHKIVDELPDAFPDVKILKGYLQNDEPLGRDKLIKFGETIYGENDPYDIFYKGKPIEFTKHGNDVIVKIKLPYATKENLDLFNKGGELVVEVGNWKRIMYLPQTMANMEPAAAELKNGYLYITLK